jgi:hypothetical protein
MAKKKLAPVPEPVDGTAFILQNPYAEFVLMHTDEIVSSYYIFQGKDIIDIGRGAVSCMLQLFTLGFRSFPVARDCHAPS